jgi:hypothetical protein
MPSFPANFNQNTALFGNDALHCPQCWKTTELTDRSSKRRFNPRSPESWSLSVVAAQGQNNQQKESGGGKFDVEVRRNGSSSTTCGHRRMTAQFEPHRLLPRELVFQPCNPTVPLFSPSFESLWPRSRQSALLRIFTYEVFICAMALKNWMVWRKTADAFKICRGVFAFEFKPSVLTKRKVFFRSKQTKGT